VVVPGGAAGGTVGAVDSAAFVAVTTDEVVQGEVSVRTGGGGVDVTGGGAGADAGGGGRGSDDTAAAPVDESLRQMWLVTVIR
jgi:hypothetical protein